MNRPLLASLAASLFLMACPKAAPGPQLGGSEDEQMDAIAAQHEEYRTKTQSDCRESCDIKQKICRLSDTACEIAGRYADRAEYQKRCVNTQEECARFNEACSACAK